MNRTSRISSDQGTPRPGAAVVVGLTVTSCLLAACTGGSAGGGTAGSAAAPGGAGAPKATPIGQPEVRGLSVAPQDRRVDLAMPTFSNPTDVSNPLFPVSSQESVLLLGMVDGKDFRTEVTLLPNTRIIDWNGQRVEVLVSQYVAYLDGRLHEVAYDLYAQDDTGAVWYFGEDVFNFEYGAIADTHGTWIAGTDGPAAMIMPAKPRVGDVYRPENIPGLVFEEVTVKAVDQTLRGPLGPVTGGLRIEELHMDGFTEAKTFGPRYGEFYTGGGGDVEALALAVPTDQLPGPMPADLDRMSSGALALFEQAGSHDWTASAATLNQIRTAYGRVRDGDVPTMIEPRLARAIDRIASAVAARNPARTRQAALAVATSSFDLQLRHRKAVEIDIARFDLWLAQLLLDTAARDETAMRGDFFALDYIRDRILHKIKPTEATTINAQLEQLLTQIGDGRSRQAARTAREMRSLITSVQTN